MIRLGILLKSYIYLLINDLKLRAFCGKKLFIGIARIIKKVLIKAGKSAERTLSFLSDERTEDIDEVFVVALALQDTFKSIKAPIYFV